MSTNLSANFSNVCENAQASIDSDIAKNSYHEQLHTREFYELIREAIDDEIKNIDDKSFTDYFGIENNRYNLLKKILPFLEWEIWLSDDSCSTPFHSLTRTLDDWRLHVLLWFYQNRFEIEEFVHRQPKKTDNNKSNRYTDNLFYTPHRLLYAYAPFSVEEHRNRLMFIGPVTAEPDETESRSSLQADIGIDVYLTITFSFFTKLLEKYDVCNDKRVIPKERELAEALTSRRRFTDKEIELRADGVRQSWNSLEQVEVDDTLANVIDSGILATSPYVGQDKVADHWGREHIEHLAYHILWSHRTVNLISQALSGSHKPKSGKLYWLLSYLMPIVIKESWFDGNIDRVVDSGYLLEQKIILRRGNCSSIWKILAKSNVENWQDKLTKTKTRLESIKASRPYHSLDLPRVLGRL